MHDDLGGKIIQTTNESQCIEVVRAFYYFMLGSSYNKNNILDAFNELVMEHEEMILPKEEDND